MLACARCGVRSHTVGESLCTVCRAPLCAYCAVLGNRTCAAHVGASARPALRPVLEVLRDEEATLPAGPIPEKAVRVALASPPPQAVPQPVGVEEKEDLSPAGLGEIDGSVQEDDVH